MSGVKTKCFLVFFFILPSFPDVSARRSMRMFAHPTRIRSARLSTTNSAPPFKSSSAARNTRMSMCLTPTPNAMTTGSWSAPSLGNQTARAPRSGRKIQVHARRSRRLNAKMFSSRGRKEDPSRFVIVSHVKSAGMFQKGNAPQ